MTGESQHLDTMLKQAAQRRAERQDLLQRQRDVEADLAKARQSAARWRRQAARSAERLAEGSGFWRRLFGRDADGERHQRDLDDAKRQHEQVDTRIGELLADVDRLRARLEPYADAEARYQQLLAQKEERLRAADPELAERLDRSAAVIGEHAERLARVKRIVEDGRNADLELRVAAEQLGRARSAGVFDMAGGGAVPAFFKHRSFGEAKGHLDRASRHLDRMSASLRHHADALRKVGLGVGDKVLDFVFDNLLTDLLIQGRINAASDRVKETLDRVRQVVWSAEKEEREVAARLRVARDERARFIEQAG